MRKRTMKIAGMSCNHCVQSVTRALLAVDGVSDVHVDLLSQTATFSQSSQLDDSVLAAAVENTGFTVQGIQ